MAELSLSVLGKSGVHCPFAITLLTPGSGLALPTIQAVISAKSHSTDRKTSRLDAVTIAELQNDLGEEWFDAIHSNLRLYEEVVEPNVDEKDRVFASVIRARICHIIEDMQATAQELARASKNPQSKEKDLIANKDKLEELGKYLNRFLFVMSRSVGTDHVFWQPLVTKKSQSFGNQTISEHHDRRRRAHRIVESDFATGEPQVYLKRNSRTFKIGI